MVRDSFPLRDRCRVFLTGFMGTGKSTVAQGLARRWGWSFVDLDTWITDRVGRSIPEIFRQGEGVFRQLEWKCLQALREKHWIIVATGGGTVEIPGAVEWMRTHGWLIWLDVPWSEILRRMGPHPRLDRPLWQHVDQVWVRWQRRQGLYAQAHCRIHAEGSSEQWIDAVERWLRGVVLCCTP